MTLSPIRSDMTTLTKSICTLAERKRVQSACNTSEFLDWEWRTRLAFDSSGACPMCDRACCKDEYVEIIREDGHLDAYLRCHCRCGFVWTMQTKNEAERQRGD